MWRIPRESNSVRTKNRNRINRVCNLNSTEDIRGFQEIDLGRKYDQHFRNPVHIEPYHVPDIYYRSIESDDTSFMISPKADGVPKALEISYNNGGVLVLHVETIGDTYYTIDVLETSDADLSEKSFEERLVYLEKISSIQTIYSISPDYRTELIRELNYLTDTTRAIFLDNRKKIVIKPVFKIDIDSNGSVSMERIGGLFSELYLPYDTTEKLDQLYPNDGWVLYRNYSYIPIKIKPYSHLTLDVRYDGIDRSDGSYIWTVDLIPGLMDHRIREIDIDPQLKLRLKKGDVYRCDPVNDYTDSMFKWRIAARRPDKALPNRYHHYMSLVSRCSYEWKRKIDCRDMLERYTRDYGSNYYDCRQKERTSYQNLQNKRIMIAIESMVNKIDNMNMADDVFRVIDIGSGICNMYLKILRTVTDVFENRIYVEYYGIDKDPMVLAKAAERKSGPIRVWGDVNGSNGFEEYYSEYLQKNFDSAFVTLINSMNYADDLNTLLKGLVKMIDHGYVLIFSMFSDLIDTKFDRDADPDLMIKHIDMNKYEFRYPWREQSFVDRIYSTKDLESAVNRTPEIQIDIMTDEINNMINPNLIQDVDYEYSFLEIHRVYVLRIR